ncbi:MAG: cysteine--tRNA ligase [Nitrososphaerota archaeon]|nr:cysteine--tRNA ligase [Nitrososphaerota archaeon]
MSGLSPTISLYDTLTGGRVTFDSREQKKISIYNCGLTVYDRPHLGHAKEVVLFDLLRRVLAAKGFSVTYVQNFTDADDKIIDKARRAGLTAKQVSDRYITEYFDDFAALNVPPADVHPRASENIKEMQEMISGLMDRGHAYAVKSGVYFDVASLPGYGRLSKMSVEELKSGARVEPDPHKRSPADFALWKLYEDEPLWDSPWGKGRPGWHIECSAMVRKLIGEPVDIHGGGADLIFPHHENELAQTEAYSGRTLARSWVHVGLLRTRDEKMSKSLGNVLPAGEAVRLYGPNTVRYYLLSAHYRGQLDLLEASIRKANENWRVIESAAYSLSRRQGGEGGLDEAAVAAAVKGFDECLSSDIDTPGALAQLVRLSRMVNKLFSQGRLGEKAEATLGPAFRGMFDAFGFRLPSLGADEARQVEEMVASRAGLRAKGLYEQADEVRRELMRRKVLLIDWGGGTMWMKSELWDAPAAGA